MRLTIIGCSGSFPGPGSPASCYLVEAEGFRLLLDLGNGALGALQRYCGLYDVDAICLSHLHADHCLDLCSYTVARLYAPGGARPPIPVYGPPGTADRITRAYSMEAGPEVRSAFDFVTLTPGPHEVGPFRLTARHVNHPVETFGLRLEHGGHSLAFSARPGAALPRTGRKAGQYPGGAGAPRLLLPHLLPWNDPAVSLAEAKRSYPGPTTL